MAFNNEIEKTKKEIEVLTAKLALLEEMENHKTPCEIAYKDWWGEYPSNTWQCDVTRWEAFKMGYNASQKDYKVGEYQETAQEPKPKEEPKTLYQTLCDSGWNEWSANDACDIVKEWIYEYNCDNYEACREYLNGYQQCQIVLEERLK